MHRDFDDGHLYMGSCGQEEGCCSPSAPGVSSSIRHYSGNILFHSEHSGKDSAVSAGTPVTDKKRLTLRSEDITFIIRKKNVISNTFYDDHIYRPLWGHYTHNAVIMNTGG